MTQPFDADLLDALRSAHHIAVLTGAGVSAESGVPTFRDALTGLWARYDPAQLATPEAFERDPELVARWYDERRCSVARCVPNAGHVALAQLQRQTIDRGGAFTLITQNVDRLHQAAGSMQVVDLHGRLDRVRCMTCRRLDSRHDLQRTLEAANPAWANAAAHSVRARTDRWLAARLVCRRDRAATH